MDDYVTPHSCPSLSCMAAAFVMYARVMIWKSDFLDNMIGYFSDEVINHLSKNLMANTFDTCLKQLFAVYIPE